jgi:hypothetical protein
VCANARRDPAVACDFAEWRMPPGAQPHGLKVTLKLPIGCD